ncbi:MAG: hypothetical protein OEY67_00370 [Gammaproteobacteria bacterium]|nr:hypothetical protein [Gammaproteobacteria bacterium]
MKKFALILVVISTTLFVHHISYSDTALPVIEPERIIFINSKVLEIKPDQIVHKEPLDAYRLHEPIRYREQAVLLEDWQRVIVSKHMNYFEGPRGEVRVYDYQGNLLTPAIQYRGRIMIIGPANRIFLGQRSRSYRIDSSLLLNSDGKLVATIPQSQGAYDFALSPDGKMIVIYASGKQKDQNITSAKLIDTNGKEIRSLEVSLGQTLNIEHEGQKYDFVVPPIPPNY